MVDLKPAVKEIDGTSFAVEMLDVKTARAVLVRAARALGPALGELGKAAGSKGVLDVGTSIAAGALGKLTENLSEADLEFFCEAFRRKSRVHVEGGWIPLQDLVFTGRMGTMFKWLAFAFEVNFSDFLAGALAMSRRPSEPQANAASPSPSPIG